MIQTKTIFFILTQNGFSITDFYAEEDDVMGYLYYVFYLGTVSFVGIWNAFQTFYILASFVRLKLQKKDKSKISGTAPNVGDEFYYFETEYRL